jgi:transposase
VRFHHPGQQVVLQDYIDAVITAEQRVARLTRQITELMPAWSMAPVATAIQAMRGAHRAKIVERGLPRRGLRII